MVAPFLVLGALVDNRRNGYMSVVRNLDQHPTLWTPAGVQAFYDPSATFATLKQATIWPQYRATSGWLLI